MPEPVQQFELPCHPASASRARHLVRAAVIESGNPELADDAELLTSEVVTNALAHAGEGIHMSVSAMGAGVRVEVTDGSHQSPIVREHDDLAGNGRGMQLLDLLSRWGVAKTPSGKAVWFELGDTRGTRT